MYMMLESMCKMPTNMSTMLGVYVHDACMYIILLYNMYMYMMLIIMYVHVYTYVHHVHSYVHDAHVHLQLHDTCVYICARCLQIL